MLRMCKALASHQEISISLGQFTQCLLRLLPPHPPAAVVAEAAAAVAAAVAADGSGITNIRTLGRCLQLLT